MFEYLSLLFTPSVDSLVAQFKTTSEKLRKAASRHVAAAVDAHDESWRLRGVGDAHSMEATRAINVADKIDALIA